MKFFIGIFFLFAILTASSATAKELLLRDNLKQAQPGDFIVTAQNKTYTLLLVREKAEDTLSFEEITIPTKKVPQNSFSWRYWVENGAPGHTCWVRYAVNLSTGAMDRAFSFTKNEWYAIPQNHNFLSTMLNLHLKFIPEKERKKVGPRPNSGTPDWRPLWQPHLVVDGQTIPGINFTAWKTRWPKDGSELSNKAIEVYVPSENKHYPSYFPYWLQISGLIGKAKIRIVDSGSHLISPQQQIPLGKKKPRSL